jgi:hypothetical protein
MLFATLIGPTRALFNIGPNGSRLSESTLSVDSIKSYRNATSSLYGSKTLSQSALLA